MIDQIKHIEFFRPFMSRECALKIWGLSKMSNEDKFMHHWEPSMGKDAARESWRIKKEQESRHNRSALVMGDIEPYKSQIDGKMIMSRSQHRTHLKDNNCIEIGNETSFLNKENKGMQAPKGLKEELIQQVNAKLRYK